MTARVLDLGRITYEAAWKIQLDLTQKRALDQVPDTLLLLEHDHVITLGRKTSPQNFKPQSVPVFTVERGGDATYHGPGQLVGYPIIKLEDHDVRKHVRQLEDAITATVGGFGIQAGRIDGHPGVWVKGKKLASIGIAVTNWVSYHGFALNVDPDMAYFELIRPCGLDPSTMTSMRALLSKPVSMAEVKVRFVEDYSRSIGEAFEGSTIPSVPA